MVELMMRSQRLRETKERPGARKIRPCNLESFRCATAPMRIGRQRRLIC